MSAVFASRRRFRACIAVILAALPFLSCSKDSPTAATRAGPPAQLNIVGGEGQSGTVGEQLSNPLIVKVVDANGLAVKGQAVNFRVTAGGGTVFAGASVTN